MIKGIRKRTLVGYFFAYTIVALHILSGSQPFDDSTMEDLAKELFLSEPLQDAEVSLLMAEGDKELFAYKSKKPLIPASNAKLFISAAALLADKNKDIFPPLKTFARGSIEQGVLQGDLILDSCGSLIFSARFEQPKSFEAKNRLLAEQVKRYAEQLRSAGITTVNGDIKLSFERWNASPKNAHYAPASAFSYNENTVDTLVENSILKTVPENPLVFKFESTREIEDQDVTEDNCVRYNPETDSTDFWRISNVSANEYALSMLKQELRKHGIKILEQPLQSDITRKLLFETATTLRINDFINPLNKYSDNFRAEILALLLAKTGEGKAEYTHLNKTIHGIFADNNLTLDSLTINDGSGLSRNNRVSAFDIAQLLQFMATHASFENFKSSLAIASKTGTLEERFKGTVWENSFYGKTGTLNEVSALSGYWFRKDKPIITFAFIGNGADNKDFWKALEKFALLLEY